MTLPTDDEIRAASKGIDDDGPGAGWTTDLALLCVKHPILRGIVDRMTMHANRRPDLLAVEQSVLMGAMVTGLNYGLRIAERRVDALAREPGPAPTKFEGVNLWAWLGEDEHGSGEIGLKQANCSAGCIPMVGVTRRKMEKFLPQFEAQASRWGKRIRLCRFVFKEVIRETVHGK